MATTTSAARGRNIDLQAAVETVTERYVARTPESRAQFERACDSLPGGNTRTGMFYAPYPLAIARGAEANLWDLDGHEYRDFVGDYTAGLYGHSHPLIRAAVRDALDAGMVFGSTSPYEEHLARLICARFASIDLVRFCNSGTEANTLALLAARAVTGRDAIMVFEGAYHGGTLSFPPGGSPLNLPFPTIVGRYNDAEGASALVARHGPELGAVLVEPMQGAGGSIPGSPEFLAALRSACSEAGVILIFDEVMTSRLGPGGRQGLLDIIPDMTTLGKYIGGGLSFGAFGGRTDIMERFDPRRADALVHHGTFNNNIMMLAAGAVGLEKVFTPEAATRLSASGERLRARLNALAAERGAAFRVTGLGSVMTMHFQTEPIRSVADILPRDANLRQLLHLELINHGLFTTRRGLMALSLALDEADHDALVEGVAAFLAEHGHLLPEA